MQENRNAEPDSFSVPGISSGVLLKKLRHVAWRLMAPLPDRPYVSLKYFTMMGRFPDLDAPTTFSEKVQFRKLNDRNPLYPTLVDKADAKCFIHEKVGGDYVIPTYWVGTDLHSVDWSLIPRPAVVKPTHASGNGYFIHGEDDIAKMLADDPASRWLSMDHSRINREWAYSPLQPRIIIEKMLQDDGRVPWDYRLFTFHGKVEHIEISVRKDGRGYECNYSRDWKKLPFYNPGYFEHYPDEVERPARLDEMLSVAETIAADLDFVRVDLYACKDWVAVGELTLYPGGGFERYAPPEYDAIIGARWTLPGASA